MPPMEAIKAATWNAADLIGDTADIGSVQPGRYADIIAVAGDPLKDVTGAGARAVRDEGRGGGEGRRPSPARAPRA